MEIIDPTIGQWGLFFSAFIAATIAPGGSEAVLAFLVAQGEVPHSHLLAIATFGNTLGALTTWGLGMLAAIGYSVEKFSSLDDQKALKAVRRWGVPVLLLAWLPVVGDGLCFAAGWLRLPFVTSLIAITVGKAFRYTAIIYAVSHYGI